MIDSFGRTISYLRISLTPRCNLRCVYCSPPEEISNPPSGGLLTNDEILCFVAQAAPLGLKRVRLTSGEPLLRRGLVSLVRGIVAIPGIEEVSLTTNAILLAKKAAALADAGLTRVNISLDTLDSEKFRSITRGGRIAKVFEGIAAAETHGLNPIKINTVVVRGINDDELLALAQLTTEHPWHIRFIEIMPVGNTQDWGEGFPSPDKRYFSVQDMRTQLSLLNMQPATIPTGNGPARTFRIPSAPGTVGFISPLGEHFCGSCNRLRLTADGFLRPCLLMDDEIPIRNDLENSEALMNQILLATALKPEGHELYQEHYPEVRRMAHIGG